MLEFHPHLRENGSMSLPSYLRMVGEVVYLRVKVQPRASRNAIGEALGNELKVKVTAPPVDSAANEALVKFLAEVLDCPRNGVQLMQGQTSRHKIILIRDLAAEQIARRLAENSR